MTIIVNLGVHCLLAQKTDTVRAEKRLKLRLFLEKDGRLSISLTAAGA